MQPEMNEWQKRVVKERLELDEKISKLDSFIYGKSGSPDIDPDDLELLVEQLDAMLEYAKILGQRISCF